MKREKCLQLFVLTTILVATMASTDLPLPLLPTLAIDPTKAAYPESTLRPGEAPNCPNLTLNYNGYYKAEQKEGDVLLSPEKSPPTATSEYFESTTSETSATTKTTSTTYLKTEATTSTTIDATTTSTNSTMPMKEPCVVPKISDGKQYNWWQILLDHGGKPGTLNGTAGPGKELEFPLTEPCVRPLPYDDDYRIYSYENTDFQTYARFEKTYSRFKGTASYFEDVRGSLVWKPPARANDTRGYYIDYILDDSGFWVQVLNGNCSFGGYRTLFCFPLPVCFCNGDDLVCPPPASAVPQNLLATLVGR